LARVTTGAKARRLRKAQPVGKTVIIVLGSIQVRRSGQW
jgi:hypothetical protein